MEKQWDDEIKKRRMDIVASFRTERYKILPLTSSILVGLLSLSFGNISNLIKNPFLFKISFSLLVLLIPISLFCFLKHFRYEEEDMIEKFKEIAGDNSPNKSNFTGCRKQMILYSPWVISIFLFLGIIGIIVSFFVNKIIIVL